MKIKTVILAGGSGTRLWPLSTRHYPKQFIKLSDNLSLLQKTLINNRALGRPILVIIKEHERIIKEQLKELQLEADFIIEPMAKNTATATIIAAMEAKNNGYEGIILLPCDHYIDTISEYLNTIKICLRYVSKFGICTIGIKPDYPSTEYGYIKTNNLLAEGIYNATNFVEKPTLLQAENYLKNESYFWNSGIFIFQVDFLLQQAQLWQKKLFMHSYNALYSAIRQQNDIQLAVKPYLYIKSISLDYAIMQNIAQMVIVQASFKWNDLGNWNRLWQMQNKDPLDNYCEGDIIKIDTTSSYIHSPSKLTVVIGIDNLIIINTKDTLLIVKKTKTDKIKGLVEQVTKMRRL